MGVAAGETTFLTSRPPNAWVGRVKVFQLQADPAMVVGMCDGVSDDLIPYDRNLPILFEHLEELACKDKPEEAFLGFLGYERKASFDDRTLALLIKRKCPA